MNIETLIQKTVDKGVKLSLVDGRLKYAVAREAVNELIEPLRQHKADLVRWLQAASDHHQNVQEKVHKTGARTRENWRVTIPDGIPPSTVSKFFAASLALDAQILAAGGSLELTAEPTERPKPLPTHEQADSRRTIRQRGPRLTAQERTRAQAYYAHHFNCPTCIAAGRDSHYGRRCDAGMALWMVYQDCTSSTSKGEQS